MAANFINQRGRIYLFVDNLEVGYYRENIITDEYIVVFKNPYQEKDFETEQECQEWLKSLV